MEMNLEFILFVLLSVCLWNFELCRGIFLNLIKFCRTSDFSCWVLFKNWSTNVWKIHPNEPFRRKIPENLWKIHINSQNNEKSNIKLGYRENEMKIMWNNFSLISSLLSVLPVYFPFCCMQKGKMKIALHFE